MKAVSESECLSISYRYVSYRKYSKVLILVIKFNGDYGVAITAAIPIPIMNNLGLCELRPYAIVFTLDAKQNRLLTAVHANGPSNGPTDD